MTTALARPALLDRGVPITRCGDVSGGHWEAIACIEADGRLSATHLHAWHGFATAPYRLEPGNTSYDSEHALESAMSAITTHFFLRLSSRTRSHHGSTHQERHHATGDHGHHARRR